MQPKKSERKISGQPGVVVTRDLNAQRELIWDALLQRERLLRWWTFQEFKLNSIPSDLDAEGPLPYVLKAEGGTEVYGLLQIQDIAPLKRFSFIASFTDKSGTVISHPFIAGWPLGILIIVNLARSNRKIKLTISAKPFKPGRTGRRIFENERSGLRRGINRMLDHLEEYLAACNPEFNYILGEPL